MKTNLILLSILAFAKSDIWLCDTEKDNLVSLQCLSGDQKCSNPLPISETCHGPQSNICKG